MSSADADTWWSTTTGAGLFVASHSHRRLLLRLRQQRERPQGGRRWRDGRDQLQQQHGLGLRRGFRSLGDGRFEFGLFAQGNTNKNQSDPSQTAPFVTAILKNNGTTEFALRGADATTGDLATYYKGALPSGWSPMKKQGAIVLGSGGDCCAANNNLSDGTFYEGSIVSGYPSDATENAIQANTVAAGYSK